MSVGTVEMRFRCYIFKRSVAAIVVEDILRPGQSARAAHDRYAFPDAGRPVAGSRRCRQVEVHVIRHDKVEAAIAIVIYECATRTPRLARSSHTCIAGDFGEDSVLVVVKAVLAVVGDIEIFPSIVVVVADANPLPPSGRGEAGLRGHVGERAVMIVAIQVVRRSLSGGKSLEPRSIHQKNIGPAVIVVIENRDPGPGGFNDVFLGVDSTENVLRGQPGFFGNIDEVCESRVRWDGY